MTDQHPITPPHELVEQWWADPCCFKDSVNKAARWGADQELEACCEWLREYHQKKRPGGTENLRRSRRPKPLSLKEQALAELAATESCYPADYSTIRRALEQLDD